MRAVVIGANGQDGSYLAEHLLAGNCDVTGIATQDSSRYVRHENYRHVSMDIRDAELLQRALLNAMPDQIYYLAAVHGAAGFRYESVWQDALRVNVAGVHVCLEHLRLHAPAARLFYASSLKAFGARPPSVVDELTPRRSECLYSITKNAATDLIHYYRQQHGVQSLVGYLFNHDSPRRAPEYFLPRLVSAAVAAKRGDSQVTSLHTLNFSCDWGSSLEFMQMAAEMMVLGVNDDVVFASGRLWNARQLVETLFASLNSDWQKHIKLAEPPKDNVANGTAANLSKLISLLGRSPKNDALQVVQWMLAVRLSQ